MKYLIIAKPGGAPVPPDKLHETYKASQAYVNQFLEDDRADCAYAFCEGGGIVILNANSHEEVYARLLNYPMYASFQWEIKPLLDWDKTFDTIFSAFE